MVHPIYVFLGNERKESPMPDHPHLRLIKSPEIIIMPSIKELQESIARLKELRAKHTPRKYLRLIISKKDTKP